MSGLRFLHPPRTGGLSIVKAWHLGKPEYLGHDPPRRNEGWTYGFTRNPWDRAVSLYHLAHSGRPTTDFTKWLTSGMQPDPASGRTFQPHYTEPTLHWLRNADFVGRFETRAEDLRTLAVTLGRDVPTHTHTNASEGRRAYQKYYIDRPEAVEYVADRYRQDIDVFGYEFEPMVDPEPEPIIPSLRFLHVPRTGGNSIVKAWGLSDPEYKKHVGPSPAVFSYGFARNPWDRVVSIYHRTPESDVMSFRDWALMRRDRSRLNDRARPIDWMRPCSYWLQGATFVGRFEQRDQHLEVLARALGRDVPKLHTGATDRMHYTAYYDDETRAWVADEYRSDIKLYSYRYDDE